MNIKNYQDLDFTKWPTAPFFDGPPNRENRPNILQYLSESWVKLFPIGTEFHSNEEINRKTQAYTLIKNTIVECLQETDNSKTAHECFWRRLSNSKMTCAVKNPSHDSLCQKAQTMFNGAINILYEKPIVEDTCPNINFFGPREKPLNYIEPATSSFSEKIFKVLCRKEVAIAAVTLAVAAVAYKVYSTPAKSVKKETKSTITPLPPVKQAIALTSARSAASRVESSLKNPDFSKKGVAENKALAVNQTQKAQSKTSKFFKSFFPARKTH